MTAMVVDYPEAVEGLPPDEELVARLRAGDEDAFALVLDAWSGGLLRLARSFVSTEASAAEVVQETWLAVIEGIGRFEGRSSLKTWIYRILTNTAKRRGIREHKIIPLSSIGTDLTDGPSARSSATWAAGSSGNSGADSGSRSADSSDNSGAGPDVSSGGGTSASSGAGSGTASGGGPGASLDAGSRTGSSASASVDASGGLDVGSSEGSGAGSGAGADSGGRSGGGSDADVGGPTVDPGRFRTGGGPFGGHWWEFPAAWPTPEEGVLSSEVRGELAAALAELPERQRVVITLRDVEGYGSAEVCELLEISAANQRVLLHRARAFLRGKLEEYFTQEVIS